MTEQLQDLGGRYRIVETLGEGGMGVVYLAEDTTAGRRVALKVMGKALTDGAAGEDNLLRFKQEFRIMARLRHPNTCEVYDFGVLPDGRPYLTMEVVPGRGLDELIPLPPDQLMDVLRQVGLALGYIHQQGFVHLDLKPDNIRVREDGVVKLMDFGLMEVAGQALDAVRGTLMYLAPEVAKQDRVDQRSDIYSLGAVTYHLVTGRPPFEGATPLQYLRAHLMDTPRAPRELTAGIPLALESAILKMLAKEPVARFQSTADVLMALGIEVDEGLGAALLESAFVGRQGELARLTDGLMEVKGKRPGRVLWLTGDAGIGKSRLVSEFRVQVLLEEVPFLTGRCSEQASPYGPFIDVLKGALPLARERAAAALYEHAPLLSKLLPELADGRPVPALEPDQEKILLQTAFTALILGIAEGGAVLVLDDWHLADPLSLDALTYLLRQAEGAPLLVLATGRSGGETRGTVLALAPLTAAEAAAMAASMLGVEALPGQLAAQLHEVSDGVPQVLAALLDHLLRIGTLGKSRGRWQLPERIAADDLPAGVGDMLLSRLAALSPAARQVAEFAAIFEGAFTLHDAKVLLGVADEALFDALDELLQARVLDVSGHLYSVAQAALRQALYARVPAEQLLESHTAIAGYLEGRLPAGDATLAEVTAVAQHHLRGTEARRAVRWALVAAQRNLEVIASGTARALLEAGLARQDDLEPHERTPAVRLDYFNALATACHWQHDIERAKTLVDEALPLAEPLNDKPRLLELLVTAGKNASLRARNKESAEWLERAVALADELGVERTGARARVNLGRNYFFLGAHGRAREVFEQAVAQARTADLPGWHASALAFLGYLRVLAGPSQRDRGFADLAEAVAIQERVGDKGGVGYSCNLMFEVQLTAGKLREAEASALRNAEIAHELGIADDHTIALLNHAIVCLELGDLARATASGERCERLAEQRKHAVALPIVRAVLGLVRVLAGELREGLAQLTAAEALARETSQYVFSIVEPIAIDAYLHAGRLPAALNAAQELQFLLRSQESQEGQIRLWAQLAEIHGRMGQTEMAEEFADRAVEGGLELDAKGLVVRALAARAWLARQAGHLDHARKLGERAASMAQLVGGRLLAAIATAELAEACLAKGDPTATQHFQALQTVADQMGTPLWRAHALYGQSAVAGVGEGAIAMLIEAQKILRGLACDLEDADARAFLEQPGHRRILEKIPGMREGAATSPEASELTFERLQRVNVELQSVAGQYGLLFKEWTTKSDQLEKINDLVRKINETLVIEAVLDQVVLLTLDITKAERGVVFLIDNACGPDDTPYGAQDQPDGGVLVPKASFNQFGRPIPHERCSMSVCQRVIATGQALAVMDASTDEVLQASKSIAALNLRTVMCVPLQAKGKTLGVMYVDSQAVVTTFTEKDLELLRVIAGHAAVAIENAMLYAALNKRAAEVERALEQYRKADYEAATDVLTGLRNRRFFQEQAARELDICRRYNRQMAVLMIDVDHFKAFNDTHGHAVGDDVLRAMGRVLAASVRAVDLPARYGGEEFVVLCPDTDAAGASLVAERIRKAIAAVKLGESEGRAIRPVTCSIGVSAFQSGDLDLSELIDRADAALYAAKAAGRDQWQVWTAEPSEAPLA